MIGSIYFLVCALLALLGAVTVIAARSPIRCAVGLLATILGIAGLFLRLEAQFLAAIQVIVYAGAVVVLFVFVIMLLGPDAGGSRESSRARVASLVGAGVAVLASLGAIYLLLPVAKKDPLPLTPPGYGSVEAVGTEIFTNALVPFELATALLIVAVVGAVSVARGKSRVKKSRKSIENPTERLFAGPVHPRDAGQPLAKERAR